MENLSEEILRKSKELQDEIVKNRRILHEKPELHTELIGTRKFIREELEKLGCEVLNVGDGLVTNIGDSKKGKTILLRADMDALPIEEDTDLDFISTNGAMHACGHDIHASTLLAAAKILKEKENDIKGNVKLMFQAAEETLIGARDMIADGLLENPKVDAAIMIHVFTGYPIEAGLLMIPEEGSVSMAPDEFHINIQGKGGHGATPEKCVDPLNIAAHTHIALQEILSREISASEKGICVVGQMSGGSASNVVADRAKLIGCIRTTSPSLRTFMKKRLVEISEGVARTFRGEAKVEYTLECPSIQSDLEVRNSGIKYGEELFGLENVRPLDEIMEDGILSGSEDFAYVSEKVASAMFIMTMGNSKEGYEYIHHHPKTLFDESKMYRATAFYSYYAMRWLEENS